MNNPEFYKPSNKFSVPGAALMFVAMVAVGAAASWLYLVINSVIPLIYLNILLAFAVSGLIGFIGGKFVRIFKIRNPLVAIIATVIALVFVNYIKWAIYVARDNKKYIYKDMEDRTVTEYATDINPVPALYGGIIAASEEFSNGETTAEDAADKLYNAEVEGVKVFQDPIKEVLNLAAADPNSGIDPSTLREQLSDLEDSYISSGISLWEFYEFDTVLGTDVETIAKSSKALSENKDMNMLEFVKEYGKYKGTTYYLTHPGKLWSAIRQINAVGRWSIKSHRYSLNDSNRSLVKGWMLWIVWFGEMLILAIPALAMISSKTKAPFIEDEDDWAITDKPAPDFKFVDPYPTQSNSPGLAAVSFQKDPNYLFTLEPLTTLMAVPDRFFFLTYCRSKYYDHIYATLSCSTLTNRAKNQRQVRELVKYLRVDADFLATMFGRFHYQVPPLCQGVNRAEDVEKQSKERAKAESSGRPLAPQRPKATGAEAIFDEPPITAKAKHEPQQDFAQKQLEEERRQAEEEHKMQAVQVPVTQPRVEEKPPVQSFTPPPAPGAPGGSGMMDGIDTSNLDLDHFDFK